ncbi:MAG: PA14 domain-containing protein, partial [Planctomycetota bacterium]
MCRKLVLLVSLVVVVGLAGNAPAALPDGWSSQDVGTPSPGSADESNGTWTITGNGHDIWDSSDNFHYAYVPLIGDGEITARVVDNGTGSNAWSKGGVMIRETLDGPSKHVIAALTGGEGSGAAFQGRPDTGSGSISFHGDVSASPPHWVKLVREGDMITGYHSADGVAWEQFTDGSPDGAMTNPLELAMAEQVYVGLAVSSHAAGELRTWTFDNVTVGLPVIAYGPSPADGAIHSDTWASMGWNPGSTAVSHDVYFGENAADVEAGTGDTFRGNQGADALYFVVGFAGYPYPDGLVNGQTYYWRVDEIEADGTKHTGKVWSFTIPSKKAYEPIPSNGSKFVDAENLTLTWTPGFGAVLHTVYFGDDYDTVANASGGMPGGPTTFNPGPLELEKTYYWRVDEFEQAGTHTGDVWSFTTAKEGGGLRADYYNGMNFDSLMVTRTETEINFDWGNPGGPDPSVGDDNFSCRWTGEVEAAFTETYTFYAAADDGVRLWVNGVQLVDAWVDQGTTEYNGTIDLVAGNSYSVVMEQYENGGGATAYLRWSSPSTPKQIIPQAALSPPIKASSPSPSNGATGTKMTPILRWGAGDFAASHEVYFGTDADAVRNADKSSPEYKGPKALDEESYDPGQLAWFTEYFWRIDEVNTLNPESPWTGNLWSFTTGDFLVVDDFEDYNIGDNEIWFAWNDGLGAGAPGTPGYVAPNGTGSMIGDDTTGSYTEETIVHGGNKSMPYWYNNQQSLNKYSEAKLTLTAPRDWTEEGVTRLSLWFRGYPVSTGSFVEAPAGTFTMAGSGRDIWDSADEFHYAYRTFTGTGSMIAKVESVDNTNVWAKAGVMIRESLEPGSVHATMVVTP